MKINENILVLNESFPKRMEKYENYSMSRVSVTDAREMLLIHRHHRLHESFLWTAERENCCCNSLETFSEESSSCV